MVYFMCNPRIIKQLCQLIKSFNPGGLQSSVPVVHSNGDQVKDEVFLNPVYTQ